MKAEEIRNVAIIGAGFIGPGIAQVFASKNYNVRLMDIKTEVLSQAIDSIRSNLTTMAKKGLGSESAIEKIIGRIKPTANMEEVISDAHLVIEAVNENLELKQDIFQQLDRLCPAEVILATNTSVMSITEIAAKSRRRERIVGTHFWNPPYILPLVEVVKGNYEVYADFIYSDTRRDIGIIDGPYDIEIGGWSWEPVMNVLYDSYRPAELLPNGRPIPLPMPTEAIAPITTNTAFLVVSIGSFGDGMWEVYVDNQFVDRLTDWTDTYTVELDLGNHLLYAEFWDIIDGLTKKLGPVTQVLTNSGYEWILN